MISGKRKITVRMVAEAAGVSRTAVYAVLNRDAKNNIGLRPDTRRKIEKTIEELGYIPNNSARTLVSGRSNNIGILLNTSNVMFSRVIGDLLAETCVEHGYMPLLEFYNFNLELERRKLEMLFSRGVDGLFAITGGERNLDVYKRFTDFHLPLVMLGHNTPGGPNVSRVGVSEERIAATLIDFLVGNRVKSVSYLTFSEMVSNPISIREQCIFRGLEAAGIRIYHSLPGRIEQELAQETCYELGFFLPFSIFAGTHGAPAPVSRTVWSGNVYKCGDDTSHPHWASWRPVRRVNFHEPDCFGDLEFE